jgi:L-threonylcarbamoyladenylate synthase
MRIDPERPETALIERAVGVVHRGGVILYPADTIYGLGCDAFNAQAIQRLVEIKSRSEEKGFLVLVPSLSQIDALVESIPEKGLHLLEQCWPGPLTVLLKPAANLSPLLTGGGQKVGIRCPQGPFLAAWLEALGTPLVSTSANRAGEPYCGSLDRLHELFDNEVDLFMECGDLPERPPSTVVDLTRSPFSVTRPGSAVDRILSILDSLE